MIKLKYFLENNMDTISEDKKEKSYVSLAKMYNSTRQLVYILKDDFTSGKNFNPFKINENSFFGLYDTKEKIFYYADTLYLNHPEFSRVDTSELNCSSLVNLNKEIKDNVNLAIIDKVKGNLDNLDVDLTEVTFTLKDAIKSKAVNLFVKGLEVDFNSYADFNMKDRRNSFDIIVDYLTNKTSTIENISNSYIEEHKNRMYKEILDNKKICDCLKTIKDDPEYIMVKDLNNLFNNKYYKTFNMTYKKGDNVLKFKIENNMFLQNKNDYISTYNIVKSKDRDEFEEMFKDDKFSTWIYPKYIEEITYGKKVLYKK